MKKNLTETNHLNLTTSPNLSIPTTLQSSIIISLTSTTRSSSIISLKRMSIRISTTTRLFRLNSLFGGTILFHGKSVVVFIILVHGTTGNHKSKNVGDKLHFDN